MVFVQLRSGKKYNTKSKMKGKRKAYRRRGVNTSVVKVATGFPDRMITKLEYRASLDLDSQYAGPVIHDYRLNSVYDPDAAVGGGQPLWRDEYSLIYEKYRVFSAKYEIKLVPVASNGTPIRVVTLATGENGSLPTDIATAWEQNRAVNKLVPPGGDTVTVLRGNISLPKLLGQTSTAFKGDDGNFALMVTNPTNPATLRLMLASVNPSVDHCKWAVDIKIIYGVEFFQRTTPNPS